MSRPPLFRWTVGNVSDAGLDVLEESVRMAKENLAQYGFDWVICHNSLPDEKLARLKQLNTNLFQQSWNRLPINQVESEELNQRVINAIWKVCPARLRPQSHEIIVDNDLVLRRPFPQLDIFLNSNSLLLLQDPLRFYGTYDGAVSSELQLNSGLIGLPPGYDFGGAIRNEWDHCGQLGVWNLEDEQGLLAATLSKSRLPKVWVPKDVVVELHPNGIWHSWDDAFKNLHYEFTGKEAGLHFVEINRKPNHLPWQEYRTKYV